MTDPPVPAPPGWELEVTPACHRYRRRLDTFAVELHPHPLGVRVELVPGYGMTLPPETRAVHRALDGAGLARLLADCDDRYPPRVAAGG